MTAYVEVPSYLYRRPKLPPHRVAAFAGIAALHLLVLAALFHVRDAAAPAPTPQAMMVTFISEMPPQPEPVPPPPQAVKPKPQPKMIATPKPTPAAITAPPLDETPAEVAPVDAAPPPAAAPAAAAAVIPPDFVAAYLNNPGPRYPPSAIRMREQGTVMLLVLVNAQGRADKVTVETSSGHSRLDDAAVEVVRQHWRFVAAKQGDQAVAAWVKVPITFELKKH